MLVSLTDRWIVSGPGRTGSKVIIDVLRRLYLDRLGSHLKYDAPNDSMESGLLPGHIKHSHCSSELVGLRSVNVIISTRNLIDSSLSWSIQPRTGKWHSYVWNPPIKVIPFVLDPNTFLTHYNYGVQYYNDLNSIDLSEAVVISYEEFKDDLQVIPTKLGFLPIGPLTKRPLILALTKNPWSPKDWILNWDEISELCKTLEPDPRKFFTKLKAVNNENT